MEAEGNGLLMILDFKTKEQKKNKQVKRVREFTRHKMSYASFSRDKGEVMLILIVWLACYSYGTN